LGAQTPLSALIELKGGFAAVTNALDLIRDRRDDLQNPHSADQQEYLRWGFSADERTAQR
jgi:hypothetical protein